MNGVTWDGILQSAGLLALIGVLAKIGQEMWRDRRAGAAKKGQAEAAKAELDTLQAEAQLPHVTEALKLGNLAEAVTIQQQIINGMREHIAWQDRRYDEAMDRIDELGGQVQARDVKIQALEERVGEAEKALGIARGIIDELRNDSANEQKGPHR